MKFRNHIKQHWFPLTSLILICIFLGLVGGDPYYHPDSIFPSVMQALQNNGELSNFKYPGGIVIYIDTFIYGFLYILLSAMGNISSTTDFKSLSVTNVLIASPIDIKFSFFGHLVTVLFSIIGALATYFTTYKILGKISFSWLAGLYLCTSLLWVIHSHYLTVDIPMASLSRSWTFTLFDGSNRRNFFDIF